MNGITDTLCVESTKVTSSKKRISNSKIIDVMMKQHKRLFTNLFNGTNYHHTKNSSGWPDKPAYYHEKYGYKAMEFHREVIQENLIYVNEEFEKLKDCIVDMIKSYEEELNEQ